MGNPDPAPVNSEPKYILLALSRIHHKYLDAVHVLSYHSRSGALEDAGF